MDHLWERYWSLFLVAWFMLGSPGEWSRNHHHDNGVLTAFSKWWFLRKNPRKALVGSLALNASVFLTFWVSSLWLVHTEQNLKEKAHFNYSDCTYKYSRYNFNLFENHWKQSQEARNLASSKDICDFLCVFQTLCQGRKFLRISSREKKVPSLGSYRKGLSSTSHQEGGGPPCPNGCARSWRSHLNIELPLTGLTTVLAKGSVCQ